MNEPLVSIITPTFNHARFIKQCVGSVLDQTYTRWEMIIVDDASTDGTAEIVRSFEHANITLLEHDRRWGADRLSDTYNQALAHARGERIAVLEGDDWWAPARLARQMAALEDPSVVLAYADCTEVSEQGRAIQRVTTPVSRTKLRTDPRHNVLHVSTLSGLPAATLLFRTEALRRIGGFRSDGLPLVDFPTVVALCMEGDFVRVPGSLAFWRRHPGSVYWQNMQRIVHGCHDSFARFVDRGTRELNALGIDIEDVLMTSRDARARMLADIPYFDAKYELLYGDRSIARRKLRTVMSEDPSVRHKFAGLVGMVASVSSPGIFAQALRIEGALRLGRT